MATLPVPTHPAELLAALRALDTCTIADAIERSDVRLRNEGFATTQELHCRFPELSPMLGYAATVRVRTANPPLSGGRYPERSEWWESLTALPEPHVLVIEDVDRRAGMGAFVGGTHAAIFQALGCVGVVTNGAVRSLPEIEGRRLPIFSSTLSPSHAYVHVVETGTRVEVGGLSIAPGDLLHGDRHGIVRIPHGIAADLPASGKLIRAWKQRLTALCDSPEFTREAVRNFLSAMRA